MKLRGAAVRFARGGRAVAAAALAAAALLPAACGGEVGEAGRAASADSTPGAPAPGVRRQQAGDTADAGGGGRTGGLTTLDVAGHEVKVEVADDESERRRGLMHRDSLPEDRGMLFVYPEEQTLSFWMRNTDIPLDVAFIDRRGYIVDIQQMDPRTEEMHRSSRPAMYALEMNRGWFEAHGVEEGDRVRF